MAESTYHQAGEQHIRLRRQSHNQARLVHQLPPQSHRHSEPQVSQAAAGLEAHLQALVAVQDSEHQRLWT